MTTPAPTDGAAPVASPAPRPWEAHPPQTAYAQTPSAHTPSAQTPQAHGNLLRRWPVWAQNTALIVGAVAVLVIVFFAGFFTAQATDGARGGFGTNQDLGPRQFGGVPGTGSDGTGSDGTGTDGTGSGS